MIEEEFLNPQKVDIYTEDEATNKVSFIRKESFKEIERTGGEVNDSNLQSAIQCCSSMDLDKIHKKGKRTLTILNNALLDRNEKDGAASQ